MISTSIGGEDMAFVPYWIDPATARQTIEAGQAIVLDVTSPFIENAVRGKIPGALRVSPRAILDRNWHAADLVNHLPDLSHDKTIIAYCTCADEEASARLTRVLRSQGYDAWLLEGGLPAWRAAGYPMELNQAVAA
jgi:rhodanese-related sulfurtransferase